MSMTFDLSDIPAVDAADLAAAMRSLIENGRGLVLLNGATDADLDTARTVMQSRHHAEPQRALASFVRFRHLVDVFGARRLWRMDAHVDRMMDVDTIAGNRQAYRVKAKFDRRPTPGLDNRNPPKVEVDIFLANDETQAPLMFTIRQGAITADAKLVRWSLTGSSQEDGWSF